MVKLEVDIDNLANEASELIRAFYPRQTVDIAMERPYDGQSPHMTCKWQDNLWITTFDKDGESVTKTFDVGEPFDGEDDILYKRRVKDGLKVTVYNAIKAFEGRGLPYGMLTGVRPLAISNRHLDTSAPQKTVDTLMERYDISPEKAELLTRTSMVQRRYMPRADDVSLYLHVPFCTTRCNYCSFPSELLERVLPHLDGYMKALEKETEFITSTAKGRLETLYVGGGTPTALPMEHFERLCRICSDAVSARGIGEFTLEAGRPDTIDEAKLRLMKAAGVTRISINPQTMNDKTLERIGRQHTSRDIVRVYELARSVGFDNINMDLIVGLTGETKDDVKATFDKIHSLAPDGITVHVLALKHASQLNRDGVDIFDGMDGIEELIAQEYERLDNCGYFPYYLYRQKYMLGGLENVGFCKEGCVCRYNIRMMDNDSTCWAAGAGSASKRCYAQDTRIERSVNPKNAADYIARLDECIEKKRAIMD